MKIVLVHNFYRQAGGEDVVFQSEKRLLERAGHTIFPYVRSNMELSDATLVDRIGIAYRMIWSQKTRQSFAALLDAECPDVVHAHNTFMVISPSIYSACSERGIPVVQTLHNFRLLCPASSLFRDGAACEECVDHSLFRSVLHGCYRNSRAATGAVALMLVAQRALGTWQASVTRFIALTEFAKQRFVHGGFPSDKLVVKPNFMDADPGERVRPGEYAVCMGRLSEDKGLRALLSAWKKLPTQYPLQIVGDGPDRFALEAQARELQLSGVTFRGQLPRATAIETVKGARCMITSSISEGLSMSLVESFACGTPVICSRVGGMTAIVDDHVTGLHFNPGDSQDLAEKVEWAWNHPWELVRMGRAARRKYESDYTAEKNYSLIMKIYEEAIAACASPNLAVTRASSHSSARFAKQSITEP
jgi:glycosyltransferase involved in cell wall biosynthesis